ncbi:MAG: menaquinone biosynthesis decarboxylase [Chitinophagales bacterium]|jgi:4-hydroxy-3-polyprenylbenzoate decarboxylase|nr:menaquinone biosynthesis decarboxylase [Bacteroidota bacterium]MBK9557206.1 menaquinone biosynthesis decarboxylase [Bacteroidota bacterium]MBP9881712.1 menaquinone biosynthesis decarboxylase [Chitinophagales bacterium]
MQFKNLQQFIDLLEKEGELLRIKEFVNPNLEITEIADRFIKNDGPALLFENTGTDFPLLINSMGSYKRMCMALGVNELDDIGNDIEALFKKMVAPKNSLMEKVMMLPELGKVASYMPKTLKGKGECQQVIMDDPDITKLPVMTCWPADGGPFITLPVIHTLDPENNTRNVGMYRMQVFGPKLTGMHWHKHKVSAGHFNKYKKLGKRMPVSVALGGDPVYTYCATAPLPPNVDEYLLAGFIRKRKVELVKCITNDLYVPADADFIIEGYVDPEEDFIFEGPFGDHTGYYSLADYYPKFHITCITHKKNAVYPSTIVGIPPQEDAWIGKATERIFITPIKLTMLPEVEDMELPIEGVFHNLTIVKIKTEYEGHAQKVMNAMWGAGQMMFNKILVITDKIDIHNYAKVADYVSKHVDPYNDIYFSAGPMDVLDHSCSKFAFGSKVCIDATEKTDAHILVDARSIIIDTPVLQQKFPAISGINTQLLKAGFSVIAVGVKKTLPAQIETLHKQLVLEEGVNQVKFIIYVDDVVELSDFGVVTWNTANNIDPRRDMILSPAGKYGISHCGIDGTRKTKKLDNFQRDWPNVIAMDAGIIETIDRKWEVLGLGKFLPSPSLKYVGQVMNKGAVVIEN